MMEADSILLQRALSQYGVAEIRGVENNPEIIKYYHETGRTWVSTEETPWCDAFVDWCAMKEGFTFTSGLYAREWLLVDKWGGKIVEKIEDADLVMFWRVSPDAWQGHIGIPIREDGEVIWVLGGNQKNSVCIEDYPIHRKLAYLQLP